MCAFQGVSKTAFTNVAGIPKVWHINRNSFSDMESVPGDSVVASDS